MPEKGGIRAVAIGNVGLEAGAEREIDAAEALQIAARRVRAPCRQARRRLGATAHYYVFGPAPRPRLALAAAAVVVVDRHGSVRLETDDAEVLAGPPACVLTGCASRWPPARAGAFGLGPRLYLLTGRRLLDLSALNKAADALAAAEKALAAPGRRRRRRAGAARPAALTLHPSGRAPGHGLREALWLSTASGAGRAPCSGACWLWRCS